MSAGSPSASPFNIAYTQADYGLRAHVTGTNGTLETTLAYWRDIAGEVRRLRPSAVLVVDDMDGEPPPPEELLTFVLLMKGEGMEDVHIAYVERDTLQIPQIELAGLMAYEHGFNARIFDSEAAAVAWLRYGER
ncbi:MAG: hypothetical protein ABI538_05085 [Pseudoxanthomonas sp.]